MKTVTQAKSMGELTSPLPAPTQEAHQVLLLHVSDQTYAIALKQTVEVLPMVELSRPPCAPAILMGILNLAGRPVPVLSLARLFHLPEKKPDLSTPLVIVRTGQSRMALLVDRVSRITRISQREILPVPENHSLNDCAIGLIRLENEIALLLSVDQLLLDKEQQCLAEIEAMEERRLQELEGGS